MTDKERLRAGKYQLQIYSANQYRLWRIAMIKTIKHILENADVFYMDLKSELRQSDDETGDKTIHHEIRNGLLFEALAQSMQAIEELFSMMKNTADISYFIRSVVIYNASEVNKYIRNFDAENIEYIMEQMRLLYFPLDEPWENAEVFETYKMSVLLIQDYLRKMIIHHKRFALHYNQYKHGQAIALRPFANPPENINEDMTESGLMVFDSYSVDKKTKRMGGNQNMMIPHLHPDIAGCIRALHDENNLLTAEIEVTHIDELLEIAEMAFTLLNVFWKNLKNYCDMKDEDKFIEQFFPLKDYHSFVVIGFPKDDN